MTSESIYGTRFARWHERCIARQTLSQESWQLKFACSRSGLYSDHQLIICLKNNNLPRELLLAVIHAMCTSSNTHEQLRGAISYLLTEVCQQ